MIDYRVELLNKRIRNRFRWENILRHENKILLGIQHRIIKERAEIIASLNHSPGECPEPKPLHDSKSMCKDAELVPKKTEGMGVATARVPAAWMINSPQGKPRVGARRDGNGGKKQNLIPHRRGHTVPPERGFDESFM